LLCFVLLLEEPRTNYYLKRCYPIRGTPHAAKILYLSSEDIEPFDWYRFFGGGRRGLGGDFLEDMFRGFDQMKRNMGREINGLLTGMKPAFGALECQLVDPLLICLPTYWRIGTDVFLSCLTS